MSREIEVSHWGQIWLEDTYELVHEGAKLKGGFSRLAYSRAAIDGIVPIIHMDILLLIISQALISTNSFAYPSFDPSNELSQSFRQITTEVVQMGHLLER